MENSLTNKHVPDVSVAISPGELTVQSLCCALQTLFLQNPSNKGPFSHSQDEETMAQRH